LGIYYARLATRGKRKWVSLRTRSFHVAKGLLYALLQEHQLMPAAHEALREGKANIGELAAIYLETVQLDNSIKDSSKEYRAKTIKYLFRSWPALKDRPPAKVTEGECLCWAAQYRTRFSETLYNNTLGTLRAIFALAIKRGLVVRNPAEAVERIKVPQKKLELPSSDQFRQIVEMIRNAGSGFSSGNGDLVEFLTYTGLRANEAAGVRWQDIDFERGRIYVAPGKNDQSRIIPILGPMRDLLTRIQASPRWFRKSIAAKRDAFCQSSNARRR
jgi:integrase